jgi:arylsulfatase
MTRLSRRAVSAGAAAALLAPAAKAEPRRPSPARRPNIVLIVADDLGYSDLGAFGGEIRTPNLDALALAGTRFTNFHVAAGCAPTRAMLMAGVDNHRTGLGAFPEMIDAAQAGKPGYEGALTPRAVCVASLLQAVGYRTVMAGKWHLGYAPSADPSVRGFDRSFTLVGGGASHFGLKLDASPGPDVPYREDGRPLTAMPPGFFSTDFYVSKLIEYLGEPAAADRPFFAYLPFTAPHYPLHAPPEDMGLYRGRYDGGWGALIEARWDGMRRAGVLPAGAAPSDQPLHALWDKLSSEDKALSARRMEIYAAMIDRMDRNVGRLVAWLKANGRYEDTIFLFMSDNGPEGTELDKSERHAALGQAILKAADNSLDALGGPRSYAWYGPGWAHACAAPFRMFKHYPTEGGIRAPAFVCAPGRRLPGVASQFVFVTDVPRTLLDWAGAQPPTPGPERLPYTGVSFAGLLEGHTPPTRERKVGWELWGRLGYRDGRWKVVLIPDAMGSGRWELYDVEADPSESRNLAAQEPERLGQLIKGWNAYAFENGVVPPAVPGL